MEQRIAGGSYGDNHSVGQDSASDTSRSHPNAKPQGQQTRWKPSEEQKKWLLREFERDPYPDVETKLRLAKHLEVKRSQVSKWFQHKRESLSKIGQFRGQKQRERRTKEELKILEEALDRHVYPNSEEIAEVLRKLNGSLSTQQVKLWFKHRRNMLAKRGQLELKSQKKVTRSFTQEEIAMLKGALIVRPDMDLNAVDRLAKHLGVHRVMVTNWVQQQKKNESQGDKGDGEGSNSGPTSPLKQESHLPATSEPSPILSDHGATQRMKRVEKKSLVVQRPVEDQASTVSPQTPNQSMSHLPQPQPMLSRTSDREGRLSTGRDFELQDNKPRGMTRKHIPNGAQMNEISSSKNNTLSDSWDQRRPGMLWETGNITTSGSGNVNSTSNSNVNSGNTGVRGGVSNGNGLGPLRNINSGLAEFSQSGIRKTGRNQISQQLPQTLLDERGDEERDSRLPNHLAQIVSSGTEEKARGFKEYEGMNGIDRSRVQLEPVQSAGSRLSNIPPPNMRRNKLLTSTRLGTGGLGSSGLGNPNLGSSHHTSNFHNQGNSGSQPVVFSGILSSSGEIPGPNFAQEPNQIMDVANNIAPEPMHGEPLAPIQDLPQVGGVGDSRWLNAFDGADGGHAIGWF